ncbi:MAG: hypothetical protein WAU70_07210 [Flavobacteriales bacterium]
MKTPLLLTCAAFFFAGARSSAQVIPSDVIGDTGWIMWGADSIWLVRAADGNVWMQSNFGADRVATAYNDAAAFGDLYQWGRWHDLHSLPTSQTAQASTLSQNNPLGLGLGSDKFYIGPNPGDWWCAGSGSDTWSTSVSSTSGLDPCASLGTGWQLPSQAQWTAVLAAEIITNRVTAFDSNLKLAAAGARDGQSGIIINAGTYGQYWSSTASGVYAKDLTVGDTWVNPDDEAYRSYGMCVRCLHASLHVGVEDHDGTDGLQLFPNPTNDVFTVDHGAEIIRSITVRSADMRIVRTLAVGATSTTLSLDGFTPGCYGIMVETAKGPSWHRLVLQR